MTQCSQNHTWSKLTTATVTAITTIVATYFLADFYAALPRFAFCIIATITILLLGTILLATRRVNHLHIALMACSARAKHAEAESDRLQQELDQHGKLKQELVMAKQTAEASVLAKGEFLATMSHEIRTPLNGIIPILELIAKSGLEREQRDLLQTATESSLQLLRIVDDILDYSKLEANKLELEITTFNLRELLEGVTLLMQRISEAKRLALELTIDPTVSLLVRGDQVRLRQVLSNLIGNAIKFTERGRVDVKLRRLGENRTQHLLRFEVHDTGIGISSEQQARLFSSFSQADASTTRLYGGTGLGLAICKRIIDLMSGRIGMESQLDVGSTLWFEIPLLKVAGELTPQTNTDQRVLLVCSDSHLSQRVYQLLEAHNMDVVVTETTQEAMEQLRQTNALLRFGVVVGDHISVRYSARALHRAVQCAKQGEPPRMVWLHGEELISEELLSQSEQVSRLAPDVVLLTALSPDERAHTKPDTTIANNISAPLSRREARILLVEDNPVNLVVAQKILIMLGYQPDSAVHGKAALQSMQRIHYDLVFMDCQMPVLDGYAATRCWRDQENAQGSRLPIVAMTANAMTGDRERCLEAGMDDYLSKPISHKEIEACLHRWLSPSLAPITARTLPPGTEIPSTSTINTVSPIAESKSATASVTQTVTAPDKGHHITDLPALDHEMLGELKKIAGEHVDQIIYLFLKDAPKLITQLQESAARRETNLMSQAAHTLKSSSANVGALALSDAAQRIESAARSGNIKLVEKMVALLVTEYERARSALNLEITHRFSAE